MHVTVFAFLLLFALSISIIVVLLGEFIKKSKIEIKKQQEIEARRKLKFHYKSTPKERKYGITIFVLLFTSPFVNFLWLDFGGEMIINNTLGFIIIYLGLGISVVWLHEKYFNKRNII